MPSLRSRTASSLAIVTLASAGLVASPATAGFRDAGMSTQQVIEVSGAGFSASSVTLTVHSR